MYQISVYVCVCVCVYGCLYAVLYARVSVCFLCLRTCVGVCVCVQIFICKRNVVNINSFLRSKHNIAFSGSSGCPFFSVWEVSVWEEMCLTIWRSMTRKQSKSVKSKKDSPKNRPLWLKMVLENGEEKQH